MDGLPLLDQLSKLQRCSVRYIAATEFLGGRLPGNNHSGRRNED
jgi:hypothetical protein